MAHPQRTSDGVGPDDGRPKLSPVVRATGFVSFFTDMGSEIIYPILPMFLAQLGATRAAIGAIEGLAEGVPALIKLFSGVISDRVRNRKWLILAGYTLSTIFKPLIALSRASGQVLVFRLLDRVGKGIRTAPRDAIVADHTDSRIRGHAFGFQRAMDHAGAVSGGLIGFAFLAGLGFSMKQAIAWSVVPGVLSVLTIVFFIREKAGRLMKPPRSVNVLSGLGSLPRDYFFYVVCASSFTLANSSDAFLLLRARDMGVPLKLIPLLWSALHAVKALLSVWGGKLSDRRGRMPVLITGWTLYAAVYLGFAVCSGAMAAWLLFAVYGVFFGFTEGASRAIIADLVPEGQRGTAFGFWGMIEGMLLIGASLLTGWLWDRTGSAAVPLAACAALSFAAAIALGLRARMARPRQKAGA
jgi:MFS family permease